MLIKFKLLPQGFHSAVIGGHSEFPLFGVMDVIFNSKIQATFPFFEYDWDTTSQTSLAEERNRNGLLISGRIELINHDIIMEFEHPMIQRKD